MPENAAAPRVITGPGPVTHDFLSDGTPASPGPTRSP
jgi:hypothetical protein